MKKSVVLSALAVLSVGFVASAETNPLIVPKTSEASLQKLPLTEGQMGYVQQENGTVALFVGDKSTSNPQIASDPFSLRGYTEKEIKFGEYVVTHTAGITYNAADNSWTVNHSNSGVTERVVFKVSDGRKITNAEYDSVNIYQGDIGQADAGKIVHTFSDDALTISLTKTHQGGNVSILSISDVVMFYTPYGGSHEVNDLTKLHIPVKDTKGEIELGKIREDLMNYDDAHEHADKWYLHDGSNDVVMTYKGLSAQELASTNLANILKQRRAQNYGNGFWFDGPGFQTKMYKVYLDAASTNLCVKAGNLIPLEMSFTGTDTNNFYFSAISHDKKTHTTYLTFTGIFDGFSASKLKIYWCTSAELSTHVWHQFSSSDWHVSEGKVVIPNRTADSDIYKIEYNGTIVPAHVTTYLRGEVIIEDGVKIRDFDHVWQLRDGKSLTMFVTDKAADAVSVVASNYVKSANKSADGKTLTITNVVNGVVTSLDFSGGGSGDAVTAEAATNIADYVSGQKVNTKPVWSKSNLWCVEFQLGYTSSESSSILTVTNACGSIWDTKIVTYTYGNYADLYPVVYDEYVIDPPIVTSYRCDTAGGTIDASGHLTTTGNGLYHCVAIGADGRVSAVDIPIQSTLQEIAEKPIYTSDLAGSSRKAVNDAAKTLMTSPASAGTGTYGSITYNIWNYFSQPAWAATQSGSLGNVKAFALGTTVMASAAHYSWHSQGEQTVGSTTVTKGAAERLYDWAIANGWSKATVDAMNIYDIEVIPLTSGSIPLADLPYLMTEEQLNNYYGGSLEGIQCWTATQAFAQPNSRVYTGEYGTGWSDYHEAKTTDVKPWRSDITSLITALGTVYPVHSGDSGHPVYFKDGSGRFILTSHFKSIGGGPSYIKGYPVIKAYVEAHGGQIRMLP